MFTEFSSPTKLLVVFGRMIRKVAVRLAALALAALAATLLLLVPGVRPTRSGAPRHRQALTGILHVTEESRPPSSAGAATFAAARRPQPDQLEARSSAPAVAVVAVSKYGGGSASTQPSGSAPCCAFWPPRQLNVSLTWPVAMKRPITVLMKAGNLDGRFACDVPCQYVTHAPADGGVDVVVGEAARPVVPEQVRLANPRVLTAARSMESASYYPALKQLSQQVDAAMLTSLAASQVPVTYLRRSSIAMWGSAPVVWNETALLALAAGRGASAVFVARNCASRNGREQARPATPPRRHAARRRHPPPPPTAAAHNPHPYLTHTLTRTPTHALSRR